MHQAKFHSRLTPLLTTLLLGACAGDALDRGVGSSRLAEAAELPVASVVAVTCEGDMCPEASYLASVSDTAFTTTFSEATISGEPERLTRRSARLHIDLVVPAGYQLGSAPMSLQGSASHTAAQGFTLATTRYAFEGSSRSRFFVHELSSGPDSFLLADRPRDLWSPSCAASTPTTVRLNVEVTAWVMGAERLFALDSIDGAFTYLEGLEWRRCGESAPLRPPPGEIGATCGGLNEQPCAAGLACEYTFEIATLGACVDPNQVVPPQPAGEYCGGYRAIPCAEGLACRFASERSVVEQRRGACTPTPGAEGDSCGGYPDVPCAEELTCFQQNMQCVHDTGAFKSRCGEGLTPCREGLYCNGTYCAAPSASQGEACGGPLEVRCKQGLVCADGVCQPK
jgi:hypothetical protein